MYIMPFMDTSRAYKAFLASSFPDELTQRENNDLRELMVQKIVGPAGQFAITIDEELTEAAREQAATSQESY